ncbi:MAG: DUF4834 domain-containing protein [Cytophagaceae bacterium]|nr:DUF4834 domain-containing protein [Cytophagaceae bacterium]|tara:strand:- start:2560 stop:2823 length:264 start_codon:yes stop_codon:yes gene_type:complete
MKFLQTLLIILLVLMALRYLFKLLSPYIMRFLARKVQERFGSKAYHYGQQPRQEPRHEGETSIYSAPQQQKSSNKKVGEYIDYEEID